MKLTYFNGKGIAETSRILLAASGYEYEDHRYPLKINDNIQTDPPNILI